jgi:hypothetical protein
MFKRIMVALVPAAALVAGLVPPASAATGATFYSQEQAGYAATGAQFRFVQASLTLPDASQFASEVPGYGLSLQLWSQARVLVLGLSDSTSTSPYSPAFAVYDPATKNLICSSAATSPCPGTPKSWTDGTANIPAGDQVTFSLYYNRSTGTDQVSVFDNSTGSGSRATFTTDFTGESYTQARLGAEFSAVSPWGPASVTAPSAETHLATFRNCLLTTYSGHRSGLSTWWTHHRIVMTSTGTSSGTVEVKPHSLWNSGRNFDVYFEPAS